MMLTLVHLKELLHESLPLVVVHVHYIALLFPSNALDSLLLTNLLHLFQRSCHTLVSAMMLPHHLPQSLH